MEHGLVWIGLWREESGVSDCGGSSRVSQKNRNVDDNQKYVSGAGDDEVEEVK